MLNARPEEHGPKGSAQIVLTALLYAKQLRGIVIPSGMSHRLTICKVCGWRRKQMTILMKSPLIECSVVMDRHHQLQSLHLAIQLQRLQPHQHLAILVVTVSLQCPLIVVPGEVKGDPRAPSTSDVEGAIIGQSCNSSYQKPALVVFVLVYIYN